MKLNKRLFLMETGAYKKAKAEDCFTTFRRPVIL